YMVDQSLNVIPQIQAGTIKVYAIAARVCRTCRRPEKPGSTSSSAPGTPWSPPKDTPKEIVAMLADALSKALDDPTIQKRYVELASRAPKSAERAPAGLQKLVQSEVARITPVIKAAGVTAESQ